MLPILIPIVTMLAEKGLGLLSKAVESGSDKAVDFIEEKTGLKLSEPEIKKMSDEDISKLKQVQIDYELELSRMALLNKQEDNRHEEAITGSEVGDKQNARGSNHLYASQAEIGQKIFIQTSIIIPLLIMIDLLLVSYASELALSEAMIAGVSTLIGIALNNAYRERQSVIEFYFGSSIGSKMKDK